MNLKEVSVGREQYLLFQLINLLSVLPHGFSIVFALRLDTFAFLLNWFKSTYQLTQVCARREDVLYLARYDVARNDVAQDVLFHRLRCIFVLHGGQRIVRHAGE